MANGKDTEKHAKLNGQMSPTISTNRAATTRTHIKKSKYRYAGDLVEEDQNNITATIQQTTITRHPTELSLPKVDPTSFFAEEVFLYYEILCDCAFKLYKAVKPALESFPLAIWAVFDRCTTSYFSLGDVRTEYEIVKIVERSIQNKISRLKDVFPKGKHF